MSTEVLYGDSVASSSNLSNPDNALAAPDSTWAVATGNNFNTEMRIDFVAPTGDLTEGAGLQTFTVTCRKFSSTQSGTPNVRIELWEVGGDLALATGSTEAVNSPTSEEHTLTWDAALLAAISGVNCQIRVFGVKSGGSPSVRNTVDFDAVKWDVDYSSGAGATETPNMTGVGTVALAIQLAYERVKLFTGLGTSASARQVSYIRSFGMSGNATPAIATPASMIRSHSMSGVGTPALIAALSYEIEFPMTGLGTLTFFQQAIQQRSFSYSGVGVNALTKQIGKPFDMTGQVSLLQLAKDISLSIPFPVTGSVLGEQSQDQLVEPNMTGTASVTFAKVSSYGLIKTFFATGTSSISKFISKLFGVVATGLASFVHDGEQGEPSVRNLLRLILRALTRDKTRLP